MAGTDGDQGSGKGEPSGDELVAAFARWSAGERVADAARQRSRERWLRQQATEAATMAGVLTDLAERRAEVALSTRTRSLVGRLVGAARDFVVVEERSGAGLLVASAHLATVSPLATRSRGVLDTDGGRAPGIEAGGAWRGDPSGDREPPLSILLIDALTMLAADRSPVRLAVTNGELLLGELVAVGVDVVTLRGDPAERGNGPARRGHLYVPLAAIEVCTPR
jgi:hypothetical protein